ncbi:hypothetical protein PMAYCL1PPCAC_07932, partial [Pristionchus mayeri]
SRSCAIFETLDSVHVPSYFHYRMGKKGLNLLDEDEDEHRGFTVNKAFAERYDNWRHKEETQKMKDKYGEDYEEESESEESDDGADWTMEDEKDFLKTLSALKGEDERIYDKETRFWHEKKEGEASNGEKQEKQKAKKEKPMFLKDYERELVKRGGDIDDDGEEDIDEKTAADPSYHEKQEMNRRALLSAFNGDAEDEDGDELFTTKEKTEEQKKAEEDEYYEWIGGGAEKEISEKEKKELKGLKKAWTSSSLDDDEKFLRDYILNKKYDTDRQGAHIPSYEEIVGTTLEDDEEEEERGRDYERKYNFRFEEPDQEFIKQYPRTIASSVREGVNAKRKEKREEYKERKTREKEEKVAEIKQLKKAKKSEIEKKLAKLKKMAGDEIGVKMEDLEGDFDPKEYDKRMQELFSSSYYDVPVEGEDDVEKPVFSDMSDDEFDDGDGADDYDTMRVRDGEDDDDNEEEEQTSSAATKKKAPLKAFEAAREELRKDKESSRRRRRRNEAFVAAVRREKPVFDPKEKTFEEYFNEYYALDYEDIIGDTRTKFKYRTVAENNFGLSTEEILGADDRQLNAWASLKKAVAYRTDKEEAYDVTAYKRKGADEAKKKRILSIDFGGKKSKKLKEQAEAAEAENGETPAPSAEVEGEKGETKKKRKNRKKKKGKKEEVEGQTEEKEEEGGETEMAEETPAKEVEEGEEQKEGEGGEKKDKKKRNRKRRRVDHVDVGVSDDRLAAYGINAKKFKGKALYGKKKDTKAEWPTRLPRP